MASRVMKGKQIPTKGKKTNKNKKSKNRGAMTASRRGPTEVIASFAPIFPVRTRRRLNYYESFSLSSTLFGPVSQIFSTNGLYDPNITGGGHQAMGFDQLMVFYEHYIVVKAKLYLTCSNTNGYPVSIAVAIAADTTAPSSISNQLESGYVIRERLSAALSTGAVKTMEIACNNGRFEGYRNILDGDLFRGDVASNPTEQTYFTITGFDPDGKSVAVICEAFIEYDSWFVEPRKITPSMTAALHRLALSESKR